MSRLINHLWLCELLSAVVPAVHLVTDTCRNPPQIVECALKTKLVGQMFPVTENGIQAVSYLNFSHS
jgi:hypothetical protein